MTTLLSRHRARSLAIEFLGTSTATYDEVIEAVLVRAGIDPAVDVDPDDGIDSGEVVYDALVGTGEFGSIDDERIMHLPSMLDGTRWACAVTAADAESDTLSADALPHLGFLITDSPLAIVDRDGASTGETITLVEDGEDWGDRLHGPAGWLADAGADAAGGAGDGVVSFAFGPDGDVAIDRTSAPSATSELDDAFRSVFEAVARSIDGDQDAKSYCTIDEVMTGLLASHRALLLDVTVPPVADLVESSGCELRGALVAPIGFDWDELDRYHSLHHLATTWRLTKTSADLLQAVLDASRVAINAGDDFDDAVDHAVDHAALADTSSIADDAAVVLELPDLARAFWGDHSATETPPDELLAFVRRVVDGASFSCSGARWVAAKCLDHLGRAPEAVALLEDAERSGTDHPELLEMLAGFRADGGDAATAMRLLRSAEVIHDGVDPDELEAHQLFREIADFAMNRPKVTAGRNDPCPCGSGKKYKRCHLGQERHAFDDRALWLYSKATRFVADNRFRRLSAEIAQAMTEASGHGPMMMLRFIETPLVTDLVLAEGGAGGAFAAERDTLLPDDEALLATQWSLVERSVYEVEATTSTTLDLHDLRSGDRLTISNTTPSDTTQRGSLLLGRAFPVGDTWRGFAGFAPVNETRMDDIFDAIDNSDPIALARIIGATFAAPRITNTSGDPMRMHTLTWTVPDLVDVAAALVSAGCEDHGDGTFAVVRDTNQQDTVIATFSLDGDTLTAECNSDERADELTAMIATAIPTAQLDDHDILEMDELPSGDRHRTGSGDALDPNDPDVRAMMAEVMAEVMAQHEADWIDQPIPALDGMTPRASAADPIAREKLERLLASLPDTDDATQMSARRLRIALGLAT